jgi:hypothetical protein
MVIFVIFPVGLYVGSLRVLRLGDRFVCFTNALLLIFLTFLSAVGQFREGFFADFLAQGELDSQSVFSHDYFILSYFPFVDNACFSLVVQENISKLNKFSTK